MSYQLRRGQYHVVVCDICQTFSYIGDRSMRKMPNGSAEQPIHLCRTCRPDAMWCATHQQYHRPDVFHRHACSDCGGLFTSVVRAQQSQCPSCRRVAGHQPAPAATPHAQRPRSWLQSLFAARLGSQR